MIDKNIINELLDKSPDGLDEKIVNSILQIILDKEDRTDIEIKNEIIKLLDLIT